MNTVIDAMLATPMGAAVAYFSVAVLELVVFLSIFEVVTRYKCWDEIRKGNVAVAMATGGKIFGICNILRFCIESGSSIYESMLWSLVGFVLLMVAYFLFEFITPFFKVDEEIGRDNRAVGLISMILSISLSYVIGVSVL
ncbi:MULTISPECIES: DUF350 domain-containing protein [Saccharibacillus]|uniref:DUF350 domain-containing protein n=1 Tax=Saccharibacillus brassicae TaxID=2583377 RepID=A0A4Y6UZD5_SACBS|nr:MULTISPECIES: DUF350 domain-containing protein [Saccharibacillus]MWJ31018.1 DUF350 domain-containing protein [Saccharibacillus sp. WB 17]QDH22494.1 DUF350 domain-containing protein [Saccharibacillus brassicae]